MPSTRRRWPACPTSRRPLELGSCPRSPSSCSGEADIDRRRRARVRGSGDGSGHRGRAHPQRRPGRRPGPPSTGGTASRRRGWASSRRRSRRPSGSTIPRRCCRAHTRLIGTLAAVGDVAAARSHLEEVERIADGLRLPRFRWRILNLPAMLAALTGDLDRAERATMEAIEVGQTSDLTESTITGSGGGPALRHPHNQGRIGELVPAVEDLVRTQPGAPIWRVALAAALMRCGRLEEAQVPFDWLAADDCARVPERHQLPRDPVRSRSGCLALGADKATWRRRSTTSCCPTRAPSTGGASIMPIPTTSVWPAPPGRRASSTSPSATSRPASSCASAPAPDRTWPGPTTTGPACWRTRPGRRGQGTRRGGAGHRRGDRHARPRRPDAPRPEAARRLTFHAHVACRTRAVCDEDVTSPGAV